VKVAFGVVALGANVPAPPLTTDHAPVPVVGALPPKPVVVPEAQIVCDPPTVAVVGLALIVTIFEPGVLQPSPLTVTFKVNEAPAPAV
jgi:hypothetical protein